MMWQGSVTTEGRSSDITLDKGRYPVLSFRLGQSTLSLSELYGIVLSALFGIFFKYGERQEAGGLTRNGL